MRTLAAVALRTLVAGGLAWLAGWVMTLGTSEEEVGANIGAGLVAFVVLVGASLAWSVVDVLRGASWSWVVLVWAAVGLVVGVATALQAQLVSPGLDGEVLVRDLVSLVPFAVGLTAVPAALGALAGKVVRGSRTRSSSDRPGPAR